ncbi:MAG: hypothetical protein ABFQ95_08010 [Pseudomonadota bacterium]
MLINAGYFFNKLSSLIFLLIIFLLSFSLSSSVILKASIDRQVRDKIGVTKAREQFTINGADVNVVVQEPVRFKTAQEQEFQHGDVVTEFIKTIAPQAVLFNHILKDPWNIQAPKIINQSFGTWLKDQFEDDYFPGWWESKLLLHGVIYVRSLGNEN